MVVHGRHEFLELVGYAEEIGAVDFVHLHALRYDEVLFVHFGVGLFVGIYLVGYHLHLCGFGHALHEEQAGYEQSHLDGYGEVEDDGEEEGDAQYGDVALGVLHELHHGAPAAHIVRHHDEHAGQAGHGNVGGQGHEREEDDQQHDGVYDTGHGRASAVVDVGHGPGYGAGTGYAAEERRAEVGHALAYKFLVGVVMVAAHAVGHGGGEQRLDGAEHGDDHGRGQQRTHAVPREVGYGEGGNGGLYLTERVADGEHAAVGVGVEEIHADGHEHDGHERAGHLFRHFGREGDNGDAGQSHGGGEPVGGVEMPEVDHPLRHKVAGHFPVDGQTEKVLYLGGEDSHGDTAGKAHYDGVRDELDDGAEPEHAEQYEE